MGSNVPQEGQALRQYVLVNKILEDFMGQWWKAQHKTVDRRVLIRVLSPGEMTTDAHVRLGGVSHLRHPNLVDVLDAHVELGWPHLVYEELHGTRLDALLKDGPVPWANAAEIVAQLLECLGYVHEHGLAYGKLFHHCVLVSGQTVLLADLGVQLVVQPQFLASVPDAPLVYDKDRGPTPRGDLAAIGGLLWEIVTGRQATGDIPPASSIVPNVPQAVDEFIARCRSIDEDTWFASARDAVAAIVAVMENELPDSESREAVLEVPSDSVEEIEDSAASHVSETGAEARSMTMPERVQALEAQRRDARDSEQLDAEIKALKVSIGRAELQKASGISGTGIFTQTGAKSVTNWVICAVGSLTVFTGLWWIAQSVLARTWLEPHIRHTLSIVAPAAFVGVGLWIAVALGMTRTRVGCFSIISDGEILCHDRKSLGILERITPAQIRALAVTHTSEDVDEDAPVVKVETWGGITYTIEFLPASSDAKPYIAD